MRFGRVLAIAFAVGMALASMTECGHDATKPKDAQVEVTGWREVGGSGSVGYAKNKGKKTARNVYIVTKCCGCDDLRGSFTDPRDLDPGESGVFYGAGSAPGIACAPSIKSIDWE
jgi:hypothetical protein